MKNANTIVRLTALILAMLFFSGCVMNGYRHDRDFHRWHSMR